MAAPMHDVGKLGIPDSILHKPGKLDSDEIRLMQTHSATGYEILSKSNRTILRAAAEIAWAHHEKWNGEGYPQKLKGTEIPLNARIVAAADVFDSLLSRRSYKDCWDHDQVRDFFIEERGKHFDPAIADVLLDNFDEFMAFRKLISS
jgi:response regulator RpfG family c-di-GMP phosphodiesterase